MSVGRKEQLFKLINGFIREIEKDFSQVIPSEINKLLFEYYYNPFIWRQDGFHGDGIIFVDEHTIKIKEGTRGIAVVDTVIDANYEEIFDCKVIIKDLDHIVSFGFFGVNNDNDPDIILNEANKLYNDQIHELNGAMVAISTHFEHIWTLLDTRFSEKGVKKVETDMEYPLNTSELEFGIRFDMKEHKMNVYLNNEFLGNPFHNIPNRIVPAIGMYGDTGILCKCTVMIKQEITGNDQQK